MRKDALKMYIFALLSDGEFQGMTSTTAIASKAVKIFAADLPSVFLELSQVSAAQGGNHISAAILGKVNEVIGDISKRGLKAVWEDLQEQYNRGMEANAKSRK